MKSISSKFIALIFLVLLTLSMYSQVPPPPPPPSGHGANGNQSGGNAPIGGGLFILLGLATAYGGRTLHKILKEHKNRAL